VSKLGGVRISWFGGTGMSTNPEWRGRIRPLSEGYIEFKDYAALAEKNAALAAENERLRKAGDAMDSYIKKLEERISVIAAKEGGAK